MALTILKKVSFLESSSGDMLIHLKDESEQVVAIGMVPKDQINGALRRFQA